VQALQNAARASGNDRNARIFADIQDYHAHAEDVISLTESTGVGMTALYHLVPGPRNRLMENIFRRGLAGNMLLTRDGMWFELPTGSDAITVRD